MVIEEIVFNPLFLTSTLGVIVLPQLMSAVGFLILKNLTSSDGN